MTVALKKIVKPQFVTVVLKKIVKPLSMVFMILLKPQLLIMVLWLL